MTATKPPKPNSNPPAARWTEEQQRVIDARDASLLVSAAAGSGKTAVLVQRILARVMDPEQPMDVDELLVVTFTNAAAAEMRERLSAALAEATDEDPENRHLQRQLALIHGAQITTVDSFCLQVVRSHFHRIDLEPGFRIADAGELTLLGEEVCDAVLEEAYETGDPAFLRFVNGYGTAKSDRPIREMIHTLYDRAQTYPWPDEWLEGCAAQYRVSSLEELEQAPWVRDYLNYYRAWARDRATQYERLCAIAKEGDGPNAYWEVLDAEREAFARLAEAESLRDWRAVLLSIEFNRLPPAKDGDPEKKERVQDVRNKIKKNTQNLQKKDFAPDLDRQLEMLFAAGGMVDALLSLTRAYAARFAAEKARRNILDFADAEHFALAILVDPETKEPTEIAREYRQKFREVMTDEYQDSNYLQEEILKAVSGGPEHGENRFMVGDVKQSIYGFRQARPELFMDKMDHFTHEPSDTWRIDLHRNFRSRNGVLQIVNDIFARIMARDLGGIDYDADAALVPGREDAAADSSIDRPEVLLVDPEAGEDKRLAEARCIARRIRAMVEDQEIPGIAYRDVAILLRAMTGWTQPFAEAFAEEGVPLLIASQTGYFDAPEVQVVLSMLRVLDNPRQDIPLAALMRSSIGGFSDTDLAKIRAAGEGAPFFACVPRMAEEEDMPDAELHGRLARFWAMISDFRARVPYTPIHTLIQQIYDETGYRDEVTALPAGEQRRANLDMLITRAIAYEETSYHGLYHFVRYIDRLIRYQVEVGEAETISERENAVRLSTIHKSKGLEYPVVFVAGMGRQFNQMDARSAMILHARYGVGIRYCDAERRTKTDTLIHRAFALDVRKETLGEELRLLYVAMTRARERLILIGAAPDPMPEVPEGWTAGEPLSFIARMDAKTPWDWVLPALATYGDRYPLRRVDVAAQARDASGHLLHTAQRRAALEESLQDVDEAELKEITARFSWEYPYRSDGGRQKLSVSEIKHRAIQEAREMLDMDEEESLFPAEVPAPYVPKFVEAPEENIGAQRGTAFHRLMERLDFAAVPDGADAAQLADWVRASVETECAAGRMDAADADWIDPAAIARFFTTDLARRMTAAAADGHLVAEQPFVMNVPAVRVQPEADPDREILIQGIIDAYWEEADGMVLLDYKTDRVRTPEELATRYQAQMELYAEALSRRFPEKRVQEVWIYSFHLNRVIAVPVEE